MKKKTLSYLILLLLFGFILIQCADPVSFPPEIPIEALLSAPDTLLIENQSFILSADLWRDFAPISPPGGNPLIAILYIETVDSSAISTSISADVIYVVNNDQVWKSSFSKEGAPSTELKPYRITKIARDGPKWGPGIYVDVIVNIKATNNNFLLRAGDQYIERTD